MGGGVTFGTTLLLRERLPEYLDPVNSVVFLFLAPGMYVEPLAFFHERPFSTSKSGSFVANKGVPLSLDETWLIYFLYYYK